MLSNLNLINKNIIKEICIKLNLRIEMINDVFSLVESFINSKTHSFSEEVIIGTCVYLSGKINEDFKRLRDIINVIFFVKNKYNKIYELRQIKRSSTLLLSEDEEIYLNNLENDNYTDDKDITLIKTMYNLTIENYYILRDEILKAEQHLLRIINYCFESKSKEALLLLLNYADYLEYDKNEIQLAWDIFNKFYELISCQEIEENIFILIGSVLYCVIQIKSICEGYNSDLSAKHLNRILSLYPIQNEEKIKYYASVILDKIC